MSELDETCSRCNEPMAEVVTRVAIESGPMHASNPDLRLCARCTESFEAWFQRRHRRSSSRHGSRPGNSHSHSNRHNEISEPDYDLSAPSEGRERPGTSAMILLGVIVTVVVIGFVLIFTVGG